MTSWQEVERKYYMFTVRRQPVTIVRGQGTKVWGEKGKEYLDFTAGWGVNNLLIRLLSLETHQQN